MLQVAASVVVLVGIALGTVATVSVLFGIGALGLVGLDQFSDAYDVPLVGGD